MLVSLGVYLTAIYLREFIDSPVVFASPGHNELQETWSNGLAIPINSEQHDRESVASDLQFLAPADLEGRFRSGRKKRLQAVLRNSAFCVVGKHHESGFLIL